METRFFLIPVVDSSEAESHLNQFLRSSRVVSVDKEFVSDGRNSFWSICVVVTISRQAGAKEPGQKKRIDYREVLDPGDFAVFATLRSLRKTLAEKEGVPAYSLFTNEQLAEMVRRCVSTRTELAGINGVGEARIEKYGAQFLAALRQESQSTQDSESGSSQPGQS